MYHNKHQFIRIYEKEKTRYLASSLYAMWLHVFHVCYWLNLVDVWRDASELLVIRSEGLIVYTDAGRKPCSSTMILHRSHQVQCELRNLCLMCSFQFFLISPNNSGNYHPNIPPGRLIWLLNMATQKQDKLFLSLKNDEHLPSDTFTYGKSQNCWENPLFLWPCSIAILTEPGVINPIKSH